MGSKNTLCIRCGKERIFLKSWEETVENSLITYTSYICPDPECQKIVEQELADRVERTKRVANNHLRNRQNSRQALSHKAKKS